MSNLQHTLYAIKFLTIILSTFAFSTQYYGNTKHPILPLHCYYEELDLSIGVNETMFPTNVPHTCVKITCRDDFVLLIKHCERILLRHGCSEIPYDYTKPYPDCCFKVVCN